MMKVFPTALTMAAIFSAIGAGLYLICCITHLIRTAKQTNAESSTEATPLPPLSVVWFAYDFELCGTVSELKEAIQYINEQRFVLISVTQCEDTYTVFFRRILNG